MGRKDDDTPDAKKRRKSRSDITVSQSDSSIDDSSSHSTKRVKQGDNTKQSKSQTSPTASIYDMEEKEANSRSSAADLDIFFHATQKIKLLVKEINELKLAGTKSNSDEIKSKRVEILVLAGKMKKLNRLSQIRTRKAQEKTEEVKQKADVLHLDLQNLLYEVVHLQKEITKCNGFMSRDEDIQLVSLEDFYNQAPDAAANKDVLDNDLHKQMLARLEWELQQRKSLSDKKSALMEQKTLLSNDIESKQELLGSLQPKLNSIMESTLPLQETLGLPLEAEKIKNETSFYLPRPLYILYSQAKAFREASARYMAVTILGDLQTAKAMSSLDEKIDSDESDDSDGDGMGEGDKASNKRRKHKREKEKSRLEEQKKSILKKHPLAVKLLLSCKAHVKLEVLFSYIPALKIITVSAELKELSNKTPPLILSSSLLSCDTLFDELYPNDFGYETPNKANHFQLQKLRMMNEFVDYIPTIGKPYYWAQWVCGLQYLPEETSQIDHEPQFSLSHQHIEAVSKSLRARVQARVELQKQLSQLETLVITDSPATVNMFPGNIYNKLTSWKAIPYEDFACLTYTANIIDCGLAKKSDMFFMATLQRQEAHLNVAVTIPTNYPRKAPTFALQLTSGEQVITGDSAHEIENEVNTYSYEFLEVDKPELLLSNMLRRLQVCFDVFCEITYEDCEKNRLITRSARGRDRALPLKYVPDRNFYTHR